MSASTSPVFTVTPNIGGAVVSATADTSYTAPTHGVTVFTAGTNGSRVEEIDFFGTGATVAGVVQLYLYDGTTYHAIDSVLVVAVTPSATIQPFSYKIPFANLELKTGWTVVATSFAASQNIGVVALGGDF